MQSRYHGELIFPAQAFDQIKNLNLPTDVQIGRGLIQENSLRLLGQGTSNNHTLNLTPRKFTYPPFGKTLGGCLFHSLPGNVHILRPFILKETEVRISAHEYNLKGSEGTGQKRNLGNNTYQEGQFPPRYLGDIPAINKNSARMRSNNAA